MWLVLSLTAFLVSVSLVLFVVHVVSVCVRVLMEDIHDVFSPTHGSNSPQSPRE
jgi:hypothetical protein